MLDVEVINSPLDILSYVCSNLCSKIKINNNGNNSYKHPTIKSEPVSDTRELLLYCHESLDRFYDEDDESRDARKRKRNYLVERGFKLASKSPTQTIGFIPTSQLPTVQIRDKKRKCHRDFEEEAEEPARKMTRHNRGNLYKQLREEIVH